MRKINLSHYNQLGKVIYRHDLSAQDIGAKLGITRQSVAYQISKRAPLERLTLNRLNKYAQALNMSLHDLLKELQIISN